MRKCKACFFFEPKSNEKDRGYCYALPPQVGPSALIDKPEYTGPVVLGDWRECGMFKPKGK